VTIPATASIVIAVLGALVAIATARVSSGPGWRELAPFSVIAALASIFAACETVLTLPVSAETIIGASRIGLFAGGLHGAAWFVYCATQEGRALTRFERAVSAISVAFALVALVPHALVRSEIYARHVAWLGATYHEAYPTRLGELSYAFFCFEFVVLARRYFAKWRLGTRGALAHFVGISALLATGVNDSLTMSRLYDGPYLLDAGFFVLVACVGVTLTSRFVDDARSLEAQTHRLRATQAELVKRERLAALGELSAVVAHEVRTPVSIMFNALSVLRKQKQAGDSAALIAIVEEEAQRLKRMIDDLLAFARPQSLQMEAVELRPLVVGAAEAARESLELAPEKRPEVVVEVDDAVPTIRCDAHLVREAIVNLVTNALQATRGIAPVRVRVSRAGPRVRIAVSDDGVGVAREIVPRLFTPFFTTRPTGTGLGLAVVRRIAEAHGGEAMVVPQSAPGATFALLLPIEAVAQSAQSADASAN